MARSQRIIAEIGVVASGVYPVETERPSLINDLLGHISRAGTAWPLVVDYRLGQVDRCSDLLSAPLFTNSDYPWPRDGDKWCEPILQIDLERWGGLLGRDVGCGLLQLWDPSTHGMIRVIPTEVLWGDPQPVPSLCAGDYLSILSDYEWATGRPDWLTKPGRIVGFGSPFFDFAPWHLRRTIEMVLDPESEEEIVPAALRDVLQHALKIITSCEIPEKHRAFGMCGGNVFQWAEDIPPVLITIENDERVYTTMGSTLCICYEQTENGFAYTSHLFWE